MGTFTPISRRKSSPTVSGSVRACVLVFNPLLSFLLAFPKATLLAVLVVLYSVFCFADDECLRCA